MTKKKRNSSIRKQRSDEFKAEALKLAQTIGVSAAAVELDINPNQIYSWRSKLNNTQQRSDRENQLATEVARLKRELANSQEEVEILKKATAYFAKHNR
jgi:transposase